VSDSPDNQLVEVPDHQHPVPDRVYFRANAIVAAALAILSVYLIVTGIAYGFWDGEKPGPGFFPICVGIAVATLSAIWLVQSVGKRVTREDDSSLPDRRGLMNILLSIGLVLFFAFAVEIVGFATPFALALAALFRIVGKRKWLVTAVASVVATAAIAALFRIALGVPLPLSPVPVLAQMGI
jgi:putative tricarboxylic transport membrane protein